MNQQNIKVMVSGLLPANLQSTWEQHAPNVSGSDNYQICNLSLYLRRCICISVADPSIGDQLRDNVTLLSNNDSLNVWIKQFQHTLLPSIIAGTISLNC